MTAAAHDRAESDGAQWVAVCDMSCLVPGRGVAALVGGSQVAIYRLADDSVWALGNRDPFSGANVMSRGLAGSRGGVRVVFSPMFKQAFAVETGECLDDPAQALPWYPVRVVDGTVLVGVT